MILGSNSREALVGLNAFQLGRLSGFLHARRVHIFCLTPPVAMAAAFGRQLLLLHVLEAGVYNTYHYFHAG